MISARVRNLSLSDFVYLATAILLLLFVCHPIFGPDIWYHLAWGRKILDSGDFIPKMPVLIGNSPVANQYWLYQAVLAGIFEIGGPLGVTLFYMCIWLGIVYFWLKATGIWSKPLSGPLAFLLFAFASQLRIEYRPEHVSLLFLSFFIWRLIQDNLARRDLIQLFIVEIMWVNIHSYFVLGIGLAFLSAILRLDRKRLAFVPLLTVASFANPNGMFIYQSIRQLGQATKILAPTISEMTPLYAFPILHWQSLLVWSLVAISAATSLVCLARRKYIFYAALGLMGAILCIQAVRFMLTMVILSGPILGVFLAWIDNAWNRHRFLVRAVNLGTGLFVCFMAVFVASGQYYRYLPGFGFGVGIDASSYPIQAVDFLKRIGFTGRIYNNDYDGGYLEYFLPKATIVCDSSYTSGEAALKFIGSIADTESLVKYDRDYHFDALLLRSQDMGTVNQVLNSQAWVTAHSDLHRILFLRKSRFEIYARPLSAGTYYQGEDLHKTIFSNLPAIWAQYARMKSDPRLMETLMDQFSRAPALPSNFVLSALEVAQTSHDATVSQIALDMYKKMFRFGEDENVDKLAAELTADPLTKGIPARTEAVDPAYKLFGK